MEIFYAHWKKKETEILKKTLQDSYSHFVAVYGRRRIGKTYLIRETFNYRFTFQHAGIYGGSLREQIGFPQSGSI